MYKYVRRMLAAFAIDKHARCWWTSSLCSAKTLLFHGVNASFEALLLCLCLAETKNAIFGVFFGDEVCFVLKTPSSMALAILRNHICSRGAS